MKSAWLHKSRPSLNYKWTLGWETTPSFSCRPVLYSTLVDAQLLPRASHPQQPPPNPTKTHFSSTQFIRAVCLLAGSGGAQRLARMLLCPS